jgi:hypothetical protein
MAKRNNNSQFDEWDDDFERVKRRKLKKGNSQYKRKEKYKNNYSDDDY